MLALGVTLALGCAKSSKPAKPDCATQVDALRVWMKQVALDLTPITLQSRPRLVTHQGNQVQKEGLVVELSRGRAFVQGRAVGPAASLSASETDPLFAEVHKSSLVYLAIDKETRWHSIHAALVALKGRGLRRVAFVFDSRATATAPPPSAIDARLSAGARPDAVVAGAYRACPGVDIAASKEPDEQQATATRLAEAVPNALLACGCKAPDTVARSVHWFLFGSRNGRSYSSVRVWLNIHEAKSGTALGADAVAFTGDRQWRQVAADLIAKAAARPVFGLRAE